MTNENERMDVVYKCIRCGSLYTLRDRLKTKGTIRYIPIHIDSEGYRQGEVALCPKCIAKLKEWMDGASIQAEGELKETPLANAFREFAETVKKIKTDL